MFQFEYPPEESGGGAALGEEGPTECDCEPGEPGFAGFAGPKVLTQLTCLTLREDPSSVLQTFPLIPCDSSSTDLQCSSPVTS